MQPLILPYEGRLPVIAETAFIAHNAVLTGDIEIGAESSVWFNVVMRGDVNFIRIGQRVNIQDGTIVHVSGYEGAHTTIGDDITIGHMALIHGCELQSGCFVGMTATVMDRAVVESGAMLAAGALLPPGKKVPKGELWAGRPAKFLRQLTDADYETFRRSVQVYVDTARIYQAQMMAQAAPGG